MAKGTTTDASPETAHGASTRGTQGDPDYTLRSVARVCSILNLLQESSDGVSLSKVAEVTQLPKSSAFRYLWTLSEHRYVEREPVSGHYRLGLGFLGMQSRQLEVLCQRARPHLTALRDRFEETISLGILDGDNIIYLEIIESERGVRMVRTLGDREPIHTTALGKAVAAGLPAERVRGILERAGMEPRTPRSITKVDRYLEELTQVRERGLALDDCENETDGRCVGVALMGTALPAALSLSAPAARFQLTEIDQVAAVLREAAVQITTGADPQADPAATTATSD